MMAAIKLARIMRMIMAGIEAMLHFTRIITIRQNGTSMSRIVIPFPSDMAFAPMVMRRLVPARVLASRGAFDYRLAKQSCGPAYLAEALS
jgi:hypothetical protein